MIKPETIQEIFETARVEEVVGDFISLKKRGVNFIGHCPFHNEKTPSFTVSPAKGIYKCFGCGKGGNSVNFVMEHEHYTYPEALKFLAKKYNIEIEEEQQTPEQLEFINAQESLYHVSAFAQQNFTDNLTKTEEGKAIGLSYFKSRDFSEATIEKFQLGYCLDNFDAFTKHAIKSGYKRDQLVKSGLSIQKENNIFDRFKARVIFPIHSMTGRVIAFGGRILDSTKSKAKYVNSPETNFFKKGNNLYNLNKARKVSNKYDEVYLVEGYMDVISLYNNQIFNCVANLGTALTNKQILLLGQFFSETIICFDGDESGYKAALRAAENSLKFLQPEKQISFLFLPDGEDPDNFVKNKGKDQFLKYSQDNKTHIHKFIFNHYLNNSKKTPTELAMIEKKLKNLSNTIEDSIVKKYVLGYFLDQLSNLLPFKINYNNKNYKSKNVKSLEITKNIYKETQKFTSIEIKEFSLLYIILNNLNFFYHRLDLLNDVLFFSKENKIIFQLVDQSLKNGNFKDIIIENKFLDNINKFATVKHIVKNNDENHSKIVEIFDDIKKDLKTHSLELRIQELESKFAEDFNQTTFDEIRRLKKEQNIN